MLYAYVIFIFFSKKVIFMKLVKDMALMGLGAGAVLAYQKYNKPVMAEMEKMMNKMSNMMNKTNED